MRMLQSVDQIAKLAELMMWANNCEINGYAGMHSVYGYCRKAIIEIIKQERGVDISDCDWNLGGGRCYLSDIMMAGDEERNRIVEEYNRYVEAHDGEKPF